MDSETKQRITELQNILVDVLDELWEIGERLPNEKHQPGYSLKHHIVAQIRRYVRKPKRVHPSNDSYHTLDDLI
jgi:hypothetical protein